MTNPLKGQSRKVTHAVTFQAADFGYTITAESPNDLKSEVIESIGLTEDELEGAESVVDILIVACKAYQGIESVVKLLEGKIVTTTKEVQDERPIFQADPEPKELSIDEKINNCKSVDDLRALRKTLSDDQFADVKAKFSEKKTQIEGAK